MQSEKRRIRIITAGLALGLIGLFLPWGRKDWSGSFGIVHDYLFGFEMFLGSISLIGCAIAVAFFFRYLRRKRLGSLVFVLSGELTVLLCSLVWIVSPRTLPWYWFFPSQGGLGMMLSWEHQVPFIGAYVSLIGSVIAVATIFHKLIFTTS